jgi:cap1 methyltransferase
MCALSVLRVGGNFVCKLFDLFTPFSVGLVYLMYLCFDSISIHKPVTSRPANSERYIICKGAIADVKDLVHDYLFSVNETLSKTFRNQNNDEDVVTVVPTEIIKDDLTFYDYIFNSNER